MDDLVLGIFDLLLGLWLAFAGLRVFFAILPIAAFFIGGYGGFVATRQVFDDGVLGWLVPLVVGLGLAIGLALVSYFLWYAGALILSGAVGALLGSGLMAALDIETNWVVILVSLAGAALGALIAYFFNLPTLVVIVTTSLIGASVSVMGAVLIWAVLAGGAVWVQYQSSKDVELPEGRWSRLQPEAYARVGRAS